jgi:ACT domain-containing protein
VNLSEEEIRKIALKAINELGSNATAESVKAVVEKATSVFDENVKLPSDELKKSSGRVILTSFGMNHPGIVANVTAALSNAKCDIRDMSQKIMDEFYTMIIIIDISNSPLELSEIQNKLNKVAEELKIKIYLQHEDLFRHMHRV